MIYECQFNFISVKDVSAVEWQCVEGHCRHFDDSRPLGLLFLEENTVAYGMMRCFGRIAFPVFALLVAEGYAHTRNRMRYFLSLLAFAAISEVPWYLLNGADGTHNVMFTLALGVAVMAAFDRLNEHKMCH